MMKTFSLKTIAVAAVAAMALAVPMQAAMAKDMPGQGKTIKMARATWDTGWFQADVYKQLFEKLGYKVGTILTLKNPLFYQAVGQGDVDLWVNGWFPTHNVYKKSFQPGAKEIGYVAKGGALQGYLIDKKTADKYHIKYLSDMKKPKIRKLFDTNGDGKANLVACPAGWGCQKVISYQIKAYGLTNDIDTIQAGYAAAMADALARYQSGKPIFFYTWTPNWTVGILKPGKDVVWLQVKHTKLPPDQQNLKSAATVKNVTGCSSNPCKMGMPANDIRPVANVAFLKKNPAVASILKTVHIPLKDIFAQNAEMNKGANTPKDLQMQAASWIKAHQGAVDKWLNEARQAAAS